MVDHVARRPVRYDHPAMDSPRPGDDDAHVAYLRRLLEGVTSSEPGGEFLYATRTEGKAGFWELLGFRVGGLGRTLLGAVRFQAQSDDPLVFARRSIGHFLSAPPQNLGLDRESYPADLIELRVPLEGESVPDLLGRLKRGEATSTLYLDASHVDLAFDFRPGNPSLQRNPQANVQTRRLVFRSREGHVVAGATLNLGAKLRRSGAFLALTDVRQILPHRLLALPTLVVHRSFLAMMAEPGGSDAAGAPAALPEALSAAMANPFHLLDPRLDTGTGSG